MKIEVGEWIRSKDGFIGKVQKINYDDMEKSNYYICEKDNVMASNYLENIANHSKNLIDLIEVGDYVNGKKIEYILEPSIKIEYVAEKILCFETDYPIEKGLRCYHNCDIKSIVTHEQFESIEYKLEEEK